MITTTDKVACNILADLLEKHGVRDVVLSPGSRNAPLIVALSRRPRLRCLTVIDERGAGFTALGIAVQSGSPVAVVCTSGTALLNYSPAVAEALYRHVPLIVVSADRPGQWIDQDDSQTIRQPGALANIVKHTCDIPADIELTADGQWFANRLINHALLTAIGNPPGPVHINLRLDAPLNRDNSEYAESSARLINMITPREDLPVAEARELGCRIASPKRVMIVAGFAAPDARLNRALARLAELPNVVVLTETIANLHSPRFIGRIDSVLSAMTADELNELRPDTVITTGGALVSRHIKEYLRRLSPLDHWHVGHSMTTVDCFRRLTLRVEMTPSVFFTQLASAMQPHRKESGYAKRWQETARRAEERHDSFVAQAPWSDLRAFSIIVPAIPPKWNLHLSNGTPIRYAQLFDCSKIHRTECNRGVSGIDGTTATAIGSTIAYRQAPTLLISGDMSAAYDIGALFAAHVPEQFRMIVMANGGGGIFRFIGATRDLPELNGRLACSVNVPWQQIAGSLGWDYYEASDEATLRRKSEAFFAADNSRPALMVINSPGEESATVLRNYFNQKVSNSIQ